MLSQLTSLVPVLKGPNYQHWAPTIKSFLMAQGQWRLMKKGKPVKTVRPYVAAVPATDDAEEIPAQEGSVRNMVF
jgi:hypothetical protein